MELIDRVQLTEYIPTYGGGFFWHFQQYSVPTEFKTNNGSFGGYWVTINSEYAGKYETSVQWTINSCFTGSPIGGIPSLAG